MLASIPLILYTQDLVRLISLNTPIIIIFMQLIFQLLKTLTNLTKITYRF